MIVIKKKSEFNLVITFIVMAEINESIRHTFGCYIRKEQTPKFPRSMYKSQYFLVPIMI